MRRALTVLATTMLTFALLAPTAFAGLSGEGTYGTVDDKIVTNAGFLVIAFIPVFIFLMSMLQWRLDKRKYARKAAAKGRQNSKYWSGGW